MTLTAQRRAEELSARITELHSQLSARAPFSIESRLTLSLCLYPLTPSAQTSIALLIRADLQSQLDALAAEYASL